MTTVEMTAPERSLTQRMDALRRANDTRVKRAVVKRDLKAGRRRIVPLLLNPPECLLTCKVAEVLMAVPRVGRQKTERTLRRCSISPSKTIAGMSARQLAELVAEMRSR